VIFENRSFAPLRGPHRATSAELGVVESVDIVAAPHQQVQIEGPVLAVLEGPEAVQDQGLRGCASGTNSFMEEEAVPPEALGLALNGGGRDTEFTGDLTQAGAGDEAEKEGFEEVRALEPVGGGEGL
jgi:hypothetical protein